MSSANDQPTARDFPELFLAEQLFILEAGRIELELAARAAEAAEEPAETTEAADDRMRTRGAADSDIPPEQGPEQQRLHMMRQQQNREAFIECLRVETGDTGQQPESPAASSSPPLSAEPNAPTPRGVAPASADDADDGANAAWDGTDTGNPRVRISKSRFPGEEPFVSFMSSDQVGLALSGGGIRSATFNLGLLQGLSDLGLLRHIDYLSTVSGGGYIGGWWTAWRNRGGGAANEFFPKPDESSNTSVHSHVLKTREPEEVRHVRGFSNFLAPRVGVFSTDMWNGVVAIISGLLPSFLMAVSLLSLVLIVFVLAATVFVAMPLIHTGLPPTLAISAVFSVLTCLILFLLEIRHRKRYRRITVPEDLAASFHTKNALSALLLAAGLFAGTLVVFRQSPPERPVTSVGIHGGAVGAAESAFLLSNAATLNEAGLEESSVVQPPPRDTQVVELGDGVDLHVQTKTTSVVGFDFNSYLLIPAVAWFLTAIVLLVYRYRASWTTDVKENRKKISASGRILGRLGKAAIVWCAFVLIWELSRYLLPLQKHGDAMAVSGLATAMAIAAELFRRSQLMLSRESSSGDNPTLLSQLKSLLPQILAYAVIVIALVLICYVLRLILAAPGAVGGMTGLCLGFVLCATVLLLLCKVLNPEALGLHAYYRGRLARAYLGASHRSPGEHFLAHQNLQTIERPGDDLKLSTLRYPDSEEQPSRAPECRRPYHLVCCAANDLSADAVATLGRGSRSAVLSCDGLAIGNHVAPQADLTLASAQTASAAAFNSLMGSRSMTYGPGVSFLMTALNLRLGLWRRHPASDKPVPQSWRGIRVLNEMLSNAAASFVPSRGSTGDAETLQQQDVHLSDGGHFENLGLYELVRRHCRYIVVSDCGADPEVTFDDFGNALRRIREDFNVEIEVDLSPLKPDATGLAQQHMVVGTINYDRRNDKGILLYFKPALTGDEPDDVTQYRTRNRQFPNESTADQFYDEAQWESYRRLGEHASRSALRFTEELGVGAHDASATVSAQEVFTEAFWHWHPAPAELREKILVMTERFTTLQEKLRISQQTRLFQEICPEATEFSFKNQGNKPQQIPTQEELQELLPLLLQIMQLMEDAFVGCRLQTLASHPMNLGWVNLLHRWANSETFQCWWPIMQPLFSREFRHFLNRTVGLQQRSPVEQPVEELLDGKLVRRAAVKNRKQRTELLQGYAASRWLAETRTERDQIVESDARLFEFRIPLAKPADGDPADDSIPHAQIAFCHLSVEDHLTPPDRRRVVSWSMDDLFVPAGLWGTGIGSQFLRCVLTSLYDEAMNTSAGPPFEDQSQGMDVEFRVQLTADGLKHQTEVAVDSGTRGAHAPQETDQASRAAHADQIRFYTAAGFELRLDLQAKPTRQRDGTVQPPPQVLVLEVSAIQENRPW